MKRSQAVVCFLNCEGVTPVRRLNAALNADTELKPASLAIPAMVKCLLNGAASSFVATSIRYWLMKLMVPNG